MTNPADAGQIYCPECSIKSGLVRCAYPVGCKCVCHALDPEPAPTCGVCGNTVADPIRRGWGPCGHE